MLLSLFVLLCGAVKLFVEVCFMVFVLGCLGLFAFGFVVYVVAYSCRLC